MRISLSQPRTRALFVLALASAGALFAIAPIAVHAAPSSAYGARLAAPLAAPKQAIIAEALWKCAGDACTAPDAGSRPVLVCQQVAKKFGEVATFTTPAGALSADELTKCNKR